MDHPQTRVFIYARMTLTLTLTHDLHTWPWFRCTCVAK